MSTEKHQALIEQILQAIERDDFVLPTLPNVAVKLQELIDDPNVSADQIVSVLSSDPFVAAQIIKSANSAAFAGKPHIDSVREAAARLGYRQLRNLVLTITMNKMFNSSNPIFNKRMKHVWEHSRKVAAVSYVIALRQPHLLPDQAMLAGLMHDIGVLPLCLHIEKNHVAIEEDTLETLIIRCHGAMGAKLLKNWNFSQEIIEVVAEHEDIHRASSNASPADYVDVVTFANLQDSARSIAFAWENVTAVKKLGLSEEECHTFLRHNAERIELVEVLLGMKHKAKQSSPDAVTPPNTAIKTASHAVEGRPVEENAGRRSFLSRLWK